MAFDTSWWTQRVCDKCCVIPVPPRQNCLDIRSTQPLTMMDDKFIFWYFAQMKQSLCYCHTNMRCVKDMPCECIFISAWAFGTNLGGSSDRVTGVGHLGHPHPYMEPFWCTFLASEVGEEEEKSLYSCIVFSGFPISAATCSVPSIFASGYIELFPHPISPKVARCNIYAVDHCRICVMKIFPRSRVGAHIWRRS